MDIRKSFEILEIGINATEDEARQAYKDLVAVWHPDRFSHNPRLKKKAEGKLKEANLAHETVRIFFAATGKGKASHGEKTGHAKPGGPSMAGKTELAAELATGAVLTLWSYLSSKINQAWSDKNVKKNPEKRRPDEKNKTGSAKDG